MAQVIIVFFLMSPLSSSTLKKTLPTMKPLKDHECLFWQIAFGAGK
jgi:hypothetical protein